jgi:hypothetical protein
MIASPSDVAPERQIARDVIAEWTAVHSADKGAVILPVSWETHSAPEMGDRPQAIINERLLKNCDLLIAIFWTRIGTPTGEEVSGTVEEIEKHIAAGKETMIYFSQAPVRPDSVDPAQYEELKAFKARCQARGLCETYESLQEFREKLSRQLAVTMIRLTSNQDNVAVDVDLNISTSPPASAPAETLALTAAAKKLLKTAAQDKSGTILNVKVFGGAVMQSNGQKLNVQGDARDTARWQSALDELESEGLITAQGYKREIFRLTHAGYEQADRIVDVDLDA